MTVAAILLLVQLTGTILDPTGAPIPGARVAAGNQVATTSSDGTFTLTTAPPVTLTVSAPGFATRTIDVADPAQPLRIVLDPHGIAETLTVTARTDGARVTTPAAVTVVNGEALATAPALTLDEQLRAIPGFSLFRRSSSRVANPTTQGVTLRGMAASGASRATVLVDGVSLNDPFGGWVYWDRVPAAAIDRVEVARGGASDVYGSDAMGGAIRIDTGASGGRLVADLGEDATGRASVFGGRQSGRWSLRAAAEQFTTDGYIMVEPAARGPIDVEARSRHSSAFVATGTDAVEVRGSYFSERRGNGTPFQANATTARDVSARARGGAFGGFWTLRAGVATQGYDQTFSVVNAARTSERPTTTQRVSARTATAAAEWFRGWSAATLFVAASGRSARADLVVNDLTASGAPPEMVAPRQRSGAIAAQVSWAVSPRVTIAAGGRGELWSKRLAGQPSEPFGFIAPRSSVVWRANDRLAFRASFQDSYRYPTMNELYRGFQVGTVVTTENPYLTPEESYGFEGSALLTRGRVIGRATAFVARVNDAIVNVTRGAEGPFVFRQRDNAGTIRATGLELESEVRTWPGGAVTLAAAYTSSNFTSGELDGFRVPQVPRLSAAAGVRSLWRHARAAIDLRYASSQFDDDRNRFLLQAAAITDARVSWTPSRRMELFLAVENAFDVDQDVGRTPLRTLGLPRTARVGVVLVGRQ